MLYAVFDWYLSIQNIACQSEICTIKTWLVPIKYRIIFPIFLPPGPKNNTGETYSMIMVLDRWLRCNETISINKILHTKMSPYPCVQIGTCGTENCDGRGLMYCAWPIRVGWGAVSGVDTDMVDQRWPIKVGAPWAWLSIKPTAKSPCHMRNLCEKRVLDLVIETRMQQSILGFLKRTYWPFYAQIWNAIHVKSCLWRNKRHVLQPSWAYNYKHTTRLDWLSGAPK